MQRCGASKASRADEVVSTPVVDTRSDERFPTHTFALMRDLEVTTIRVKATRARTNALESAA